MIWLCKLGYFPVERSMEMQCETEDTDSENKDFAIDIIRCFPKIRAIYRIHHTLRSIASFEDEPYAVIQLAWLYETSVGGIGNLYTFEGTPSCGTLALRASAHAS